MHDEDGNLLNRLRVSSGIWSRISKLSKSRILDELMTVTNLNLGDMDLLRFSMFMEGTNTYNNIKVTKTSAGALHISTLGGNIMNRPCAKYIVTPLEDLWKQESSQSVTCTKNGRKAMPKSYGLKPTERNILAALPSNIVGLFLDMEGNHGENPDDDEEYLPDLMPVQSGSHQLLTSKSFNLLQDITVELKEYAPDKWQNLMVSDLFPNMLHDSKVLVSKCTKDEIRIIGTVLESYTCRAFFNAMFTKAKNANIVTRAFEGNNFVQEVSKTRCVHHNKNPETLNQQCLKLLLDRRYPLLSLQVSYASITHLVRRMDWEMKFKIKLSVKIPSHVLTNMRMHIYCHGYEFCKTEHFLELCAERPDILVIPLLRTGLIRQMFSLQLNFSAYLFNAIWY